MFRLLDFFPTFGIAFGLVARVDEVRYVLRSNPMSSIFFEFIFASFFYINLYTVSLIKLCSSSRSKKFGNEKEFRSFEMKNTRVLLFRG